VDWNKVHWLFLSVKATTNLLFHQSREFHDIWETMVCTIVLRFAMVFLRFHVTNGVFGWFLPLVHLQPTKSGLLRAVLLWCIKLRLHEACRETSQVGRLPAPSYLPRVNVYLPEIITWLASNFR
jgi:hypothetical protein